MMETLAVERTIWINAPRERVWEAITDPDQVGAWFSPGTNWRGTGLKVGGTLSVYDAENDTDMYTQVITVVDAPHKLVTQSAPPENPYTTTWLLTEENGGTRLTLAHGGYEHAPEDTRQTSMENNGVGFGFMLDNIKAHIEGEPLPFPQGF